MGIKILIVEDEVATRILAQKMLINLGVDVTAVEDGQAALEILKKDHAYSAILTDQYMPNLDGFELREILRRDSELEKIPCILMSADTKQRARARELGFFAWVQKPLKLVNLKPVLEHRLIGLLDSSNEPHL